MFRRIKLVDVELTAPTTSLEDLGDYDRVQALVRLHGAPIGYVSLQTSTAGRTATALREAVLEQHSQLILQHLTNDALAASDPARILTDQLGDVPHPADDCPTPLVTVAVCTRDRSADLERCLGALVRLRYPALDLLVVDNAPTSDATEQMVRTGFPTVRYVVEPLPGLDRARNHAIAEARGDIIAFTDDDAVVDSGWVVALTRLFVESSEVMAVTGLVVPYEIETEAQELFERYGGFGRGFQRRWYSVPRHSKSRAGRLFGGAGMFGTGANMAFRRNVFTQIGCFDPALDVGTITNGGGDLDMFFRVLAAGHTLVYEPAAMVRHRHRREYGQLRTQLENNGIGLYSYLVRSCLAHPQHRFDLLRLGWWWLWWWNIRRLLLTLLNPSFFPTDLVVAELRGSFRGLRRYQRSRRLAARVDGDDALRHAHRPIHAPRRSGQLGPMGVRLVDATQPLRSLTDVQQYDRVRLFVSWQDRLLGSVDVANHGCAVSAARLRDAISTDLAHPLLDATSEDGESARQRSGIPWARHLGVLQKQGSHLPPRLASEVPVSIVLATLDRPDLLRRCLRNLIAQVTRRPVEIVVVDNNPASGLTPPVIEEFPAVRLVPETRRGLARARNAGFLACTGKIAVAVDDDVTMPPHWLETMLGPFASAETMIVTGNILPAGLETRSEQLFEEYGGLGRGFRRFEVDGNWFRNFNRGSLPTWTLGATANAAFRTSIFSHPEIGLMDEALGAGTPTGCGEDTYLFYKTLRAGYRIAYEPDAYVWHQHRRDMTALRRQIYNYSKGHVAYHLTTLLRDHDRRAILRLALGLPLAHLWRMQARLRRHAPYPLSLIGIEILGHVVGPWALWRSRQQVKRDRRAAEVAASLETSRPPCVPAASSAAPPS